MAFPRSYHTTDTQNNRQAQHANVEDLPPPTMDTKLETGDHVYRG